MTIPVTEVAPLNPSEMEAAHEAVTPHLKPFVGAEAAKLDGRRAASTVLGSLPEITELLEQMKAVGITNAELVLLRLVALAAYEAETRLARASQPSEPLQKQFDELSRLRAVLLHQVTGLVGFGLMDDKVIKSLLGGSGHQNVPADVQSLAGAMKAAWARINGKTPLTEQDVAEAKAKGEAFAEMVAKRDLADKAISQATADRNQRLALLIRKYEEVRRAVHFVRWFEDDADKYAPSLFAQRGSRRRAEETEVEPVAPVPAPGAPLPAPAADIRPPGTGLPGNGPF